MKTIGDKIQDKALSKIGEKSLFTKGSFYYEIVKLIAILDLYQWNQFFEIISLNYFYTRARDRIRK